MRVLVIEDEVELASLIRQGLSRLQRLEGAWDNEYEYRSNVIDVYVGYLRDKLDRPFGATSFETVRAAGYRLRSG